METTLKITGNWNELKTKLKQKYPNLTDADLVFSPGKEDDLLATLSRKLGKTEDEISGIVDDLQSKSTKPSTSEAEGRQKENKQPEGQKESSKKF
jgi:uncharacterized protein YjbJ (UPF0337 family)